MRTIKLMAEFKCFPLWEEIDGGVLDIDPKDLPISETLKEDLYKWMKSFDDIYDADYPPDSEFKNKYDEEKFVEIGEKISKNLENELGKEYKIIYKIFR
ncbi:hypothetical protein [Methylobacterium indicum]|uniref:hypothetical protein n=1 Tax=Methylobacterium indicum TaxID=1775910 RepID=UPI000A80A642|nr:hypothetical protein [Methylobacterium indicum]